ncbi:MAG TPA: nucleotidyltransferase family protein [Vicinamibacterales bacterium]|nr:nucleotidyltransferase family protein [Vicinamibacterales bacterium]
MLPGIVLAAGRSERLGRPKALLRTAGHSFVATILRSFSSAGLTDLSVVLRQDDDPLAEEVDGLPFPVRLVPNARAAEGGQLSSLQAGIAALPAPTQAAMVTLVDVPLVRVDTIRRLVDAAARTGALIVRPVCRGRHGHPVVFRRDVFDTIRTADPRRGAKDVLARHADRIEDVEVDDPGIAEDVDTIEDYVRLFGREP